MEKSYQNIVLRSDSFAVSFTFNFLDCWTTQTLILNPPDSSWSQGTLILVFLSVSFSPPDPGHIKWTTLPWNDALNQNVLINP